MQQKAFRLRDLAVIVPFLALALILACVFSRSSAGAPVAVVEKDGTEFCRIRLSEITEEKTIDVGGEMNVRLLAEPGAISFLSSDCPDKTCVRTGKLTKAGQAAVCLPGRVSVRIISDSGGRGYDGYTG